MRLHRCRIRTLLVTIAVLAGLVSTVRAAERVTLRNGFVQLCNHHAQVAGRVRLYLTAGEDNYIEFAPQEIATVEQVPDPPDPPDESAAAPQAKSDSNAPQSPLAVRLFSARGFARGIDSLTVATSTGT